MLEAPDVRAVRACFPIATVPDTAEVNTASNENQPIAIQSLTAAVPKFPARQLYPMATLSSVSVVP